MSELLFISTLRLSFHYLFFFFLVYLAYDQLEKDGLIIAIKRPKMTNNYRRVSRCGILAKVLDCLVVIKIRFQSCFIHSLLD